MRPPWKSSPNEPFTRPLDLPFPHKFPQILAVTIPIQMTSPVIPIYSCMCIYIYITRGRGLDFKLSILGEHQQRDNSWFILLVYEVGNSCSNRVIGDITNWSGCHSYKLLTILRDCKLSDLDFFPPRLFDLV